VQNNRGTQSFFPTGQRRVAPIHQAILGYVIMVCLIPGVDEVSDDRLGAHGRNVHVVRETQRLSACTGYEPNYDPSP